MASSPVHWVTRVEHDLVTKQEQNIQNSTGNILNGEESDTISLSSGAKSAIQYYSESPN